MPTWEGREPSCGTVRFAGEAWTRVTGVRVGWDWVGDLEIDVDEGEGKGQGSREQGVRLETTDTGREEKPGCGGESEWQGSRGRDEASSAQSEAKGGDRTGKAFE